MSTDGRATVARAWRWTRPDLPPSRVLALGASAGLLAAVVSVLHYIVQVDGDPTVLFLLVVASLLAATALARVLRVVVAVGLAAVVLSVGMVLYVLSLPYDPAVVGMVESNLKLLSGQSILEIERSTVWALSVTPTPVFITWYLSVRGWYSSAALVGGATLGYFVLTGDATLVQTLTGVVGAAALVGFGDLDHRDAPLGTLESVVVVLAVMVVAPLLLPVAPAGSASPISFDGEGGDGTVEASIISTESELDVVGDIELSAQARFTVRAEETRRWRVASFDRYTGDGWVRTGQARPHAERDLDAPVGPTRRLEQTFEAESAIDTMPAAWRPTAVSSAFANRTEVTAIGGLQPAETFQPGDTYRVTSVVPAASPDQLAESDGDDPAGIREKYTQLPASTPDRVTERTDAITAEASNRYETAGTIERWLEENREYSLDVDRPEGNVADTFLFEMERGYCTYYATTMVAMLRSQDVPARLTVGYTPGEEVDSGEYLVRGYNSHAWVEVYFPEQGWVAFDPTPAGPRVAAEQEQLQQARSNGVPNASVGETNRTTPTTNDTGQTPTATPSGTNQSDPTTANGSNPETIQGRPDEGGDSGSGLPLPGLPSREELALGLVVVAGAIAGLHRSGLGERAYRAVWLRYTPRCDPETDIELAFDRLAYVLERRHRPRRAGETVRQYLEDVDADERAREVTRLRERARYGGEATPEMADRALELVDRIRRDG